MTPGQVLKSMRTGWFLDRGEAESVRDRTEYQRGWDSAILAAGEYLRRRLDYDETLTLELLKLQTPTKGGPMIITDPLLPECGQ